MPDSTRLRRQINADSDRIPTLPQVNLRLVSMLDQPDVEITEIEDVLILDPVLVARVMSMVNSPFYGLRHRVESIKDAITLLGRKNLMSLVVLSGAAKVLNHDFYAYGHEDNGLWKHSVSVGAAAKVLARETRIDPAAWELVFLAGLLHDIGKMVLHDHLTELDHADLAAQDSVLAAERQLLGMDHAAAGGIVLEKWQLPLPVRRLVELHHSTATDELVAEPLAVLRTADNLLHAVSVGYDPDRAPEADFLEADLDRLGITGDWDPLQAEMLAIAEEMLEQVSELSS